MRRSMITATVLIAFASPAVAQFVAPGGAIPAVAHITGEHGELWISDLSIRNVTATETSITLLLLPEIDSTGQTFEPQVSDPITITGNGQVTLRDVVSSEFGLNQVKGGLQVFSNDGGPVALGSRTYTNDPDGGTYGLNVYGVLVTSTEAWIANVVDDGFFRTNVGIFVPVDPPPGESYLFTVTVTDNAGQEVATGSLVFDQGGLRQESLDYFGVNDPLFDGSLVIRCNSNEAIWYAYATVIDNTTNDSVYRPAQGQAQ